MDRSHAARLSKRTKNHEGTQSTTQGEPQISQILSRLRACCRTLDCQCVLDHRGHKEDDAGAGRACAQGTRPARRPVERGGLRTPRFGRGAAMATLGGVSGDAGNTGDTGARGKRATDEADVKTASVAKPSLQSANQPISQSAGKWVALQPTYRRVRRLGRGAGVMVRMRSMN